MALSAISHGGGGPGAGGRPCGCVQATVQAAEPTPASPNLEGIHRPLRNTHPLHTHEHGYKHEAKCKCWQGCGETGHGRNVEGCLHCAKQLSNSSKTSSLADPAFPLLGRNLSPHKNVPTNVHNSITDDSGKQKSPPCPLGEWIKKKCDLSLQANTLWP